jgi:uncharacterized protein (TIGR00661 family)
LTNPKKIIVAPLDWGLGHATRCIPLITALLAEDCEVFIAAEGAVSILLQKEFPELIFFTLPGYKIKYSKQKRWLPLKIALQVPVLLLSIYRENQWLKRQIKNYPVDVIISDNRFGLYNRSIYSVYVTHQLQIKAGNKFFEWILQKFHYWFIKKYKECWVPDFEDANNIAGELSHPSLLPANVKYPGGLSRFEKNDSVQLKYDLLVLLSGPEPQRTILEQQLLPQLDKYKGRILLIRGLPATAEKLIFKTNENNNLKVSNHLVSTELNTAIEQAGMIVCRAGYTTIMDLIKLKKRAILIPTPGQTEQEYLALYLMKKQLFYAERQHNFLLKEAVEKAALFPYSLSSFNMDLHKTFIKQFVLNIESNQIES